MRGRLGHAAGYRCNVGYRKVNTGGRSETAHGVDRRRQQVADLPRGREVVDELALGQRRVADVSDAEAAWHDDQYAPVDTAGDLSGEEVRVVVGVVVEVVRATHVIEPRDDRDVDRVSAPR